MGEKFRAILEASRFLEKSLSNARKLAADELSKRSARQKPWKAPGDGSEKPSVQDGQPLLPQTTGLGDEAAPSVQEQQSRPKISQHTDSQPSQILPSIPHTPQTSTELQHVGPEPELTPLSSNPWINMLPVRVCKRLSREGVTTLAKLQECRAEELLDIPGFGLGSLEDVNRFLEAQNLPRLRSVATSEPDSTFLRVTLQSGNLPSLTAPLDSNPFFGMLSVRTYRLLSSIGILSLVDLRRTDSRALLSLGGFGVKCLAEVDAFLEANEFPNTKFGLLAAPAGQYAKEDSQIEALSEQTWALLRESGVGTIEDLRALDLSEVLEAVKYDERAMDEIGMLCGLPAPRDEHELLALLCVSDVARDALARSARPLTDDAIEAITRLLKKVVDQVERGTLHEQAIMDWAALQALNGNLRPPARTLLELLEKLQYSPDSSVFDAVSRLDQAIETTSLEDELELLFGQLKEREVDVLRQRLTIGHRRTLEAVSVYLNVTRERIRQIEKQACASLRQSYYWKLPLPRIRTAILLIRENRAFALQDMLVLLRKRGLATSETAVDDFLVAWRALDLVGFVARDSLVQWKVLDLEAYAFPEEILSVAKTGLTPRQQAMEKEVLRLSRRLVSRVGAASTMELAEALDDQPAVEADVAAILGKEGFSEISPGYWAKKSGYSIPREAVAKMLAFCGPLDLQQLRRGILRHQSRLGYPVLPAQMLGAALGQHDDIFRVDDGGVVRLRDSKQVRPSLGRSERVWLGTVDTHGPVVHSHSILRAFAENGLKSITAQVLMTNSTLVERVDTQLFCLPGACLTDADIESGRSQVLKRGWAGKKRLIRAQEDVLDAVTTPLNLQPTLQPLPEELDIVSEERDQVAYEGLRGYLRYDAQEDRLVMVFPEAEWPEDTAVRLTWGSHEILVPSVYSASDDSTTSRALELPVRGASWQVEAWMDSERGRRTVRLPQLPRDLGLVFGATNGRATERWRSGEEHYVVVTAARFSETWANVIFEEWHKLGRPEGWPEHLALRVRVGHPLAGESGAAAVIESFGRATGGLGLPGLERMWQPHGRLVGTPDASLQGGEAFGVHEPPYLEVDGLWDSSLIVSLARWNSKEGEFGERNVILLPACSDGTMLLALWKAQEQPQEGRYRVEVGEYSSVEFELVGPPPPVEFDKFEVRLGLELEGRRMAETLLRRCDLERGTLVGEAWPVAELAIRASCGDWALTFGVTTDEEGRWSARWRDLGVGNVPDGSVELTLGWRGLVKARLVFIDGPHIDPEDVSLRWRGRGDQRHLSLEGRAYNAGESRRVRGVLMGPRPWADEICSESLILNEYGGFEARFRPGGETRWLAILPNEEPEAGNEGVHPWLVQAQDEDTPLELYPLADLRGARRELWEAVEMQLRGASLPPALQRLLDLSALGRILEKQGLAPAEGSRWRSAEDQEALERIAEWTPLGLRSPIALFSSVSSSHTGRLADLNSSYLTVAAEDMVAAIAEGGGELSVRCATPNGNLRRIASHVVLQAKGDGWSLELHAKEQIHACPKCGLVLPSGEFWNHLPPSVGMRPCAEGRRALRQISAGRGEPIQPLLLFDRENLLSCIEDLVRRVAEGEEENVPAHTGPWLDRVQEAYFDEGGDLEPAEWFAALRNVKSRLDLIRRKDHEREKDLARLGRAAHVHESGLAVLAEWLQSEEV